MRYYLVNFDTRTIIWDRYTQCDDSDCILRTTVTAYVQSSNKVYMQTAFDFNNLNILLLTINASDGTYASNPYIWNSNCNVSEWILYNENKLYCQLFCSSVSILSVFDIATETFTNYEFDSSISHKLTHFDSGTSSLVIIGGKTDISRKMYYSSTLESSISDHPDISASSISITSTSNYASVDGAFTITDMGTSTFTSITPSSSNIQIIEDTSQGYTSDVVYYYDTSTEITVNTLTSFESSINTVCSSSGSTSIAYNLVANGNEALPTWVSFNESSFKLSGTSPELNATTAYTLILESIPSGSQNTYQTTITVNVTYECDVSN